MNAFLDEKDGLWGVVRELLGTEIDIESVRKKYKDVVKIIIRNDKI